VIEDGSTVKCSEITEKYRDKLESAILKRQIPPGLFAELRYEKATGDYFIVFDSDCIIPAHYLSSVDRY